MARTSGYVRFECDRCRTTAYLAETSVEARNWYEIRRYRSSQATSGDPERKTLCSACYTEYVATVQDQDTDFDQWMTNQPDVEKGRHSA